ncbi:hypothetical protein D3C87_1563500 [compost metagenome]|jgi:hypothetical protein
MAKSNADRSAKASAKRKERGEAITLMIHHLHGLGPDGALPLLEPPPRHEYVIPENVSRKLKPAYQREAARIPHADC